MPEFDRQSGHRRSWHLIEFLREAGWSVTFVTNYGPIEDRYVRLLQQAGVATYADPAREVVEEVVGSGRFDLVLLALWEVAEQYLPLIRSLSPSTRVVVDSVDLHFVRHARRRLRRAPDHLPPLLGPDFGDEVVRELNVYAAADAVLTVSDKEADLVNDLFVDPTLAHVVPDYEDFERSRVPWAERRGTLYLGNFAYLPNVEAIEYLCQHVVPIVDPAVLAEHPVQVVGNALDKRICEYGSSLENVRMVGWVPSVVPYLENARISVIPLLHGAGTKRKLIQALMVGTPSVTTSIGAEGLNVRDGEHVLVADSPAEFAAAIERLVSDADLWEHLVNSGRDLIHQVHSREAVRGRFTQMLTTVLNKQANGSTRPAEQSS
jgi:glycosyltransferase involved in cell wall biosynthesis